MKVLVTGAAGFLGSHVANALLHRGAEVHAVTRSSASDERRPGDGPGIEWHRVDLDDRRSLRAVLEAVRPDAAIHLAWYAEPGRYLDGARENLRSLRSTTGLLESLLDVACPRIALAGTCLESVAIATPYAAAKSAAHLAASQLRAAGLSATCAHIFYTYGRGEDPRRVIPSVIRSLLRGEEIEVGEGSEVRDYVHASDIASAFCALIEADPGPSIDVCTGQTVRLSDVFDMIGRVTGRDALIRRGRRRSDRDAFPETGDPAPLQGIGWRAAISLEAGIRDAVAYWSSEGSLSAHERVRRRSSGSRRLA